MPDLPATNVIPLPLCTEDWPAPPRAAAFTGLAGEITRAIEPHSESDPLAILVQLLVCFGSAIGRGAPRGRGDRASRQRVRPACGA